MKLSEAMRKGCVGTRQIFGDYTDHNGGLCAVGAALHAVGCPASDMCEIATGIFPILSKNGVNPVNGHQHSLGSLIVRLNDNHEWSREAIADWVALNFENEPEEKNATVVEREVADPVLDMVLVGA